MSEPPSRERDPFGPVQVLMLGVEEPGVEEMIAAELQDLANQNAIQIIDLLRVHRSPGGEVRRLPSVEHTDLSGELVEALLFADRAEGREASGDLGGESPEAVGAWFLADRIPAGATAVVLLVEHRWAIPLREAAAEFRAEIFGDAWVHPEDLRAAMWTSGSSDPEPDRPA